MSRARDQFFQALCFPVREEPGYEANTSYLKSCTAILRTALYMAVNVASIENELVS